VRNKRRTNGLLLSLVASVTLTLVLSSSCFENPATHELPGDLVAQFELLCETFDEQYSGFSTRDIDWDALHDAYIAQVEAAVTSDDLIVILTEMLGELEDADIMLTTPDTLVSPIHTYVPTIEENFDTDLILEILGEWAFAWNDTTEGWGDCFVNDSIPYLLFQQMNVYQSSFDAVFEEFIDSPGMIIDMRMCSYTDAGTSFSIVKRFPYSTTKVYYLQWRSGPEHDDFCEPEAVYRTQRGAWQFSDRPVAVLIGEYDSGSTEEFIQSMSGMPNVTLIGDTTLGLIVGGSSGSSSAYSYALGSGYGFKMPWRTWLDLDLEYIENRGVLPDIYVEATEADFAAGIDPVYDYAVEWIISQTGY